MQADQIGTRRAPVDVSVVIPTVNRVDLLVETVRSVLVQTRPPREIIVVDNGTENRAAAALARFENAVTLIKEAPLGKQVARNTGIRAASSTWIATLDDDDLYHPDYLETAEQAIVDGRADLIGADHRKFLGSTFEPLTKFEQTPPGYWDGIPRPDAGKDWSYVGRFPRERLLRRVPFYPSTMLVRRSLALELGGYDPRMRGIKAEDLEYLVRVMGAGNCAILWRPLVDYRLHLGNDTASKIGQEIGRWRIFEFIREHHPGLEPAFRQALDQDLSSRRPRAYDLAYGVGDQNALRLAGARLTARDWTARRRIMRLMSSLPHPMAHTARRVAMIAVGRGRHVAR